MGVENKTADTLSRCIFILTKMTTVVSVFERLRIKYESYPDSRDIRGTTDGITQEIDGFILQDGHLFLNCKLCIPKTSFKEFLV